ncbi:acyl-CoA carboxylase epsilon subunit [Nocardia sp. NPDC046473]|uniref:acyl-CoA carboxylase epsilon subunit n=1 Tax=Nocardia sp. NPDC046473 TaxID=3155733 RepID=UPI0033C9B85E
MSTPLDLSVLKGNPSPAEFAAIAAALAQVIEVGIAEAPDMGTWGSPRQLHRSSVAFAPTSFAVDPRMR